MQSDDRNTTYGERAIPGEEVSSDVYHGFLPGRHRGSKCVPIDLYVSTLHAETRVSRKGLYQIVFTTSEEYNGLAY